MRLLQAKISAGFVGFKKPEVILENSFEEETPTRASKLGPLVLNKTP